MTWRRLSPAGLIASMGLVAAPAAFTLARAQPPPTNVAAAAPLDAATRQAVVTQLAVALRERYVLPEVGAKAADALSANLRKGAYDKLTDSALLAVRLERDLFAIAHDEHLRVTSPGSRLSGLPAPPTDLPPPPPRSEAGVVRADRLRGGIGYIEISGFPSMETFRPVIDRAMTALSGSKALVIDDRRNNGGEPASGAYLLSFLTPPVGPVHLIDIINRTPGTETFTRQEYDSWPTPVSFAARPVYVLTSGATFSGGEAFAYIVQSLKLGSVVGEVSGGGANVTGPVSLGAGLIAFVPWGRPQDPVTKTNWEGRGVRPDIEVPWSKAFATAMSKLGQPGALNVGQVSEKQVFAPQTTPPPGAEAALRRLLQTVANGAPDYTIMTPRLAEVVRAQLPQVHSLMAKLGPPVSMRFHDFDGVNSVYDVAYAASTWRFTVALTADGKLSGSAILGPVTSSGDTTLPPPLPPQPDPTLVPYASTKDSVRLPDGRTIHMVCMGHGSPLVILSPGGNDFSFVWNKVQPAVAEKTRVCSWERAGAGLSSPSAKPQTVAETTTDLQAALKAGHFTGPFLAVGHSRGAYESLLLKDREPSKVVGMVLVDPAVPDQIAERDRVAPAVSEWERAHPDPEYAFLKRCAAAVRVGTVRRDGPDPDGCLSQPYWPPNYPPELRTALEWHSARLTVAEIAAGIDIAAAQLDPEYASLDSEETVKADRNYGNMPLIVLTAADVTPPPTDLPAPVREGLTLADTELRRDRNALATLSTRGVDRIVAGSTHMIPQIKPQVVIEAIDEAVDDTRNLTPPRTAH